MLGGESTYRENMIYPEKIRPNLERGEKWLKGKRIWKQ